jgi:hypothetical protein
MNHAQLSDVQIANLTLLLTIRDGALHPPPAAGSRSTPRRPIASPP